MHALYKLIVASLLSLALYGVVFSVLVTRPLVFSIMGQMIDFKLLYGEQVASPKLLILAGSNARFSHSCMHLEQLLHHPCVNLGVSADIGIDYLVDRFEPIMKPGDVVYIPLEYEQYTLQKSTIFSGPDAAVMFQSDWARLARMGGERAIWAYFRYDLNYLISGLTEMALSRIGFKTRFDLKTLSPQGDETGHTAGRGQEYRQVIASIRPPHIKPENIDLDSASATILGGFLDWCRAHGVIAVGGLPTTIEGGGIEPIAIEKLHIFYAAHGAGFIRLDNSSQYPSNCFYDAGYHLNEGCAKTHSEALAGYLAPYFDK